MTALAGFKADVYITATPSIAFTNEAFTDAGDHMTFSISNAAKRYWDNTIALTVQTTINGGTNWTTITSGFVVNYCGGQIILTTALTGTPGVRVSGAYFAYSLIGDATGVEVTSSLDILDSTTLASNGWKTKIINQVDAQVKLTKWLVDAFYLTAITSSTRLAVSVTTGANANQRLDGFGYIKDDNIKMDIKALNLETVTIEIDGQLVATLL